MGADRPPDEERVGFPEVCSQPQPKTNGDWAIKGIERRRRWCREFGTVRDVGAEIRKVGCSAATGVAVKK